VFVFFFFVFFVILEIIYQESILTVIPENHTIVIPESTLTVILEIFYLGSSNLSSPTWLGIQILIILDSRFRGNDIEVVGMTTLMSSPTWLGIQCFLSFSLLFSFSVIPEINKGESMFFFSLTLEERNTSWIPAFAGMTSPLSSPKTTPMSSPTWLGIQALLILDSRNRSEWQKVFLYQVWYNKTSVILENTPTVILEIFYRGSRNVLKS